MDLETFIAVYLDHASACIMQFVNNTIDTETVTSDFNYHAKKKALHKGENTMHHKEQQLRLSYLNTIKDKLKNSKHILLFGATTAKAELLTILKGDAHFNTVKIVTNQTDKMNESQQHIFLKNYTKTHLI
jgi:hypothetical protein